MSLNSSGCEERISLRSYDRKLRYKALLEDLSAIEEDADNVQQMEQTSNAVKEVQSLLAEGGVEERVKHPGEGYLDSKVLRATSDLALRCSDSVSGNINTYNKHELAQYIKENPEFLDLVFPHEVPAVCCLFGTFAPTPPEQRPRAPRRRIERQQIAALKAPEAVDRLEETGDVPEMVSRVHRFITKMCRKGSLSYFHVVLDPGSFSRTIENIYYVSFLVRDGMVAIDIDENHGLPFITTVPAAQRECQESSNRNQFIVSMDMARWKELVEAFDMKEPMMVLKR
ncbi:EP300-interacting inhibitor of differentiation 3 [Battus philenor]|uniref:EP300-interacting inhibitor of differentiation 3 n=1 Tax=Battus philenor TaxID=42288 RepID=UPI0035D0BDC4